MSNGNQPDKVDKQLRLYPEEKRTTGLVATTALGLVFFVAVASTMSTATFKAFDVQVLRAMRTTDLADPVGSRWFESLVRDVTAMGSFAVLTAIVLTVSTFLLAYGHKLAALRLFSISLTGWLLSHGNKLMFARPRPDIVPHSMDAYVASFPSGHAMTSAVVYLTLGMMASRACASQNARYVGLAWAVLIPVLVGISRIYLGVHWPSDVLAGWALGAAWVGLAWLAFDWLEQAREQTQTSPSS